MLDLERVGVFGHSTGGGATIQFCGTDPRCKAGLTLDAFTTPVSESVLNSGLQQPFLFIFSEAFPTEKNTRLFEQLYSHLPPSDRVVTILGTSHYDLSDLPMLSPLAHQLGLKGPLNGKRAEQITIDYERAFFAATLKGQNTSLFDGPSRFYPEVRYDH
jgi:pimeloyl-ACP methyl ester carboxylesterase